MTSRKEVHFSSTSKGGILCAWDIRSLQSFGVKHSS
uniref:Uncharacterized protein n=1 Tax=Tetraselmis sp. GSL018 TaxID=582737 RepID=A0A061RBZ8_9CHLO